MFTSQPSVNYYFLCLPADGLIALSSRLPINQSKSKVNGCGCISAVNKLKHAGF